MPGRIRLYVIAFVVLAGGSLSLLQGTTSDEPTIEDLGLPANFYPTKSFYATVESVEEEPGAPGFLIFTVSSPRGVYTVHGLTNLKKCLYEIDVLEKLRNDENMLSGVALGTVNYLKDTATGLKNLVVNPVGSASGIGKGIWKMGGKIGGVFRKKEKGEKGNDSYFLSSTKRELAKKLGVDVYSRNLYLQKKLDSMAMSRMGGQGVVAAATFFVPIGWIASAVTTASSINNAADELVDDNGSGDIYKLNQEALLALGFPKEKVTRFLNHPYYTPREFTYLRFYLEKLRAVKGFEAILEAALAAKSEVPADKILHEAQIAADAVTDAALVTKIIPTTEGIVVEMREKVFLATAYDCLDISPLSARVEKKLLSFKEILSKKATEIRNGGSVTSRLGETFLLKEIEVERMCLFSAATAETQARELPHNIRTVSRERIGGSLFNDNERPYKSEARHYKDRAPLSAVY